MRLAVHLALALCVVSFAAQSVPLAAQRTPFASSGLPIVLIETEGAAIVDEPKVRARMRIVDNGPGARNRVDDLPSGYDGLVGIEIRGNSSQRFPKKQYGFETWDADGQAVDASLLGMPAEDDWVLYAPYSDKSLVRNVLTYRLARAMGRYASRTRFCEVVLDGDYQGVYVLMEKIEQGPGRLAISEIGPDDRSGDALTGGYIVEMDRPEGGWRSAHAGVGSSSGMRPYYQYDTPDADAIAPEQEAYIQGVVDGFEAVMAGDGFEDPATGYPALLDLDSFVDLFLLIELGKNVDGYRLSAYYHKDRDSASTLLRAGPIWDFNLAYGNADYHGADDPTGFQYDADLEGSTVLIPFWWPKLAESRTFRERAARRWADLRDGLLHTDSLAARVGALTAEVDEAQARNFERWPILDERVWPNAYVGGTYEAEVAHLVGWLRERAAWLDGAFSRDLARNP